MKIKRALKWTAIGAGLLLAMLLIVNGALALWAQHRFDSRIAQMRAAGDPASLADLAPKPLPPEKNAAAYLRAMAPQLDEFMKRYLACYETPLGKQWQAREGSDDPPTAQQAAEMNAILDAYPTILPSLQQAAACEQYASMLDFNLPPRQFLEVLLERAGDVRTLARFVGWKMATLMADGKSEQAVLLGTQALRVTRHYDQEPLLMNYLVSTAVRGLVSGSLNQALRQEGISLDARARLDQELAAHDSRRPIVGVLRSERAFANSYGRQQAGTIAAFLRWPMLNWILRELEAEDAAYEFAKLPVGAAGKSADHKPFHQWPAELQKQFEKSLVGAGLKATLTADIRNSIQLRCLRVLNALEAYRQRSGHDAQRIDQLGLPREATIDPYTGETLLMKKSQQGWIVYSVWENGVDDGGRKNIVDGDWGVFPPGTPEVWADGSPVQSN